MKKHIYHSLIALFGGLFGVSVLFLFYHLLSSAGFPSDPFPHTFLGYFLHYLLLVSLMEEGAKFLLIKRNIGQFPYGFFLGFGFGTGELFYRLIDGKMAGWVPILLHMLTAGIICFFIKQNRPVLGLVLAIVLHTAYNLTLIYAFPEVMMVK